VDRLRPRLRAPAAALAVLAWTLGACSSITAPPAPVPAGPRYAATVRFDSAAKGTGLKVNGTLVATQLPADIAFDVNEAGRAARTYKISLNRNIIAGAADNSPNAVGAMAGVMFEAGSITIDMDAPLPSRVFFDVTSTLVTGTAVVDRVR
jgi:hypothetical protein